jgi:cell wall-associated NlpC family hydrolase
MPSIDQIRESFVDIAVSRTGVPWVHQGRNVEHGLDCVGLIITSLREAGLECWDTEDYGRRGNMTVIRSWLEDHATPVLDFTKRQSGDILIFGMDGDPYHAGILLERPNQRSMVLHCHQRRLTGDYGGFVQEVAFDGLLVKRFLAAFRLADTRSGKDG